MARQPDRRVSLRLIARFMLSSMEKNKTNKKSISFHKEIDRNLNLNLIL